MDSRLKLNKALVFKIQSLSTCSETSASQTKARPTLRKGLKAKNQNAKPLKVTFVSKTSKMEPEGSVHNEGIHVNDGRPSLPDDEELLLVGVVAHLED